MHIFQWLQDKADFTPSSQIGVTEHSSAHTVSHASWLFGTQTAEFLKNEKKFKLWHIKTQIFFGNLPPLPGKWTSPSLQCEVFHSPFLQRLNLPQDRSRTAPSVHVGHSAAHFEPHGSVAGSTHLTKMTKIRIYKNYFFQLTLESEINQSALAKWGFPFAIVASFHFSASFRPPVTLFALRDRAAQSALAVTW